LLQAANVAPPAPLLVAVLAPEPALLLALAAPAPPCPALVSAGP
jgi:hypothetical protein